MFRLFYEFFKISLFVIGGGYAIIAVADEVCAKRKWTKEGELIGALPVFQIVPGLIATHCALYVGRKLAGIRGALVAVSAVALPAVAIFTLVAAGFDSLPIENAYLKSAFIGLRSSITGIIAATIVRNWRRNMRGAFSYSLLVAAVAAIGLLKINVALVMVGAAAIGLLSAALPRTDERRFRVSLLPFLVFLKYGSLAFGGGFVLVPMYLEDFVGALAPYLQLSLEEFSNIIALSQMTPGPIGVNGVTFFGYRLLAGCGIPCGILGAIAASALLLLPGSVALYFLLGSLDRFQKNRWVQGFLCGMRPAALALMLVALWVFLSMSVFAIRADGSITFDFLAIALSVFSFIAVLKKRLNVIALIYLSAFIALLTSFI